MKLGNLEFVSASKNLDLVAKPVADTIKSLGLDGVLVTKIDPAVSDTAAFCEKYGIGLDVSANCVIVEAKRGESRQLAACLILATDRIDVNNVVRRQLDARKISFASMDTAVSLTGMEYGGITPIGLPADWPILVDERVAKLEHAIVGGGVRGSKLLVPGKLLADLPNAAVLNLVKS